MRSSIYIIIIFILFSIISCESERATVKKTTQRTEPITQETKNDEGIKAVESVIKTPETSWSMFMGDISYLGRSPDRKLKPPLELLWKFKTGGAVISSPIVVDGTVYVGSEDHRLYALNSKEWGSKWEFYAGERIIASPTFSDGYIYFSSRNNKVYALNALTGEKKWEFQADGWINSPVVAYRQKIYLGCYDNKIYTLNAFSGRLESQTRVTIKIGNYDYVCSRGDFYPLDFQYQTKQWREMVPNSESFPARANNVVYIGARDNKIYGIDYGTRKIIWQYETGGWVDSSPAIADGILYIGSNDGYVYAFANTDSVIPKKDNANLREGVVTNNGSRVHSRLDNTSDIIAKVYEGEYLKIKSQSDSEWYQVILPNGKSGWISWLDFNPIKRLEDLQINDALVKEVRRLNIPQNADKPSWSPDGLTTIFFNNISMQGLYWRGGSIWLATGDIGAPKWVADGAFYNSRISWSSNGGIFAIENLNGKVREIWVAKSNGTGMRKIAEGEAPSVSPKGDRVAFIRRDKGVNTLLAYRLDNNTMVKLVEIPIKGNERYVAYGYIADLELPAWSPDGTMLALGLDGYHYADNNSKVGIISASGGLIREIGIRSERVGEVLWSPDGKYIAFVTLEHLGRRVSNLMDKKVHIASVDRTGRTEVFEHSESVTWSPKVNYVAFIEDNKDMGMKKKVWLLDMQTWRRSQLLASKEDIRKISWLSNGKIALSAVIASDPKSRIRGWMLSLKRV